MSREKDDISCLLFAYSPSGDQGDNGFQVYDPFSSLDVFPNLDSDRLKNKLIELCDSYQASVFHVVIFDVTRYFTFHLAEQEDDRDILVLPEEQWSPDVAAAFLFLTKIIQDVNDELLLRSMQRRAAILERDRLVQENEALRAKLRRIELYQELKREFEG